MNCHSSYCFPMALQLYSFTGAWQIKMMLVWGFSLIQNHSFSRLFGNYSCKKHIFTQDIQLFCLTNTHAFIDTLHFSFPYQRSTKRLSFLLRTFLLKKCKHWKPSFNDCSFQSTLTLCSQITNINYRCLHIIYLLGLFLLTFITQGINAGRNYYMLTI